MNARTPLDFAFALLSKHFLSPAFKDAIILSSQSSGRGFIDRNTAAGAAYRLVMHQRNIPQGFYSILT